jgi:hypothetical protein
VIESEKMQGATCVAPTPERDGRWAARSSQRDIVVGAIIYLIPPIVIFLGWALLGENPPGLAIVGGALCLGGVYVSRHD